MPISVLVVAGLDALERIVGERVDFQQLREAEVGELRVAVLREQDVLGLDVAVQDPGLVCYGDPIGHADQELHDLLPPARLSGPLAQRAAVDVLRDQVLAILVFARVVHRHDVRMVQRGDHPRFALKAPPRLGVGEVLG